METEKMIWGNPEMDVQQFTPQEFVAVCEDKDKWGATCVDMASHKRGWIIYDTDMDGILDDDENVLYDRNEHGGCGQTHYFYAPERPTYNAWVLKESVVGSEWNLGQYTYRDGSVTRLNAAGIAAAINEECRALVKRPGEALEGHWLVCYDLSDLRNPS